MGEDLLQAPPVRIQQRQTGRDMDLDRRHFGSMLFDAIARRSDGFTDAHRFIFNIEKPPLDA